MELRHIRYFVSIAETGSFSASAEKLLTSQPSLSRQIKELEEELGCALFLRGKGQSTKLSSKGRLFLEYSRQILSLTDEAKEAMKDEGTIAKAKKEEPIKNLSRDKLTMLKTQAVSLSQAIDEILKK